MPFTAQTMQVGLLLANPFVIEAPSYQRPYSWSVVEAAKLLEDITSAPHGDPGQRSEYFLGAMLFIERDRPISLLRGWQRPIRLLDVVDGFQRLTTLTILLCVLRDLIDDDDAPAPGPRLLAAIGTGLGTKARHVAGSQQASGVRKRSRAPHNQNEVSSSRFKEHRVTLAPAGASIIDLRSRGITGIRKEGPRGVPQIDPVAQ